MIGFVSWRAAWPMLIQIFYLWSWAGAGYFECITIVPVCGVIIRSITIVPVCGVLFRMQMTAAAAGLLFGWGGLILVVV